MDTKDTFERAFSVGGSSASATCNCGRTFYNSDGGWDWEDGELEGLVEDKDATDIGYGVGLIEVQGRTYAVDCNCWHSVCSMVELFIDRHAHQIAEYLKLEKKRKIEEAEKSATVDI